MADGFTCGGCSNTWTGTSRCHCSAIQCHRTFSGLSLFDKHRVNGKCQDPASIMVKPKDGGPPERAMYLVDGVWQTTETPLSKAEHLKEWRKTRKSDVD